MIRGKALYNNGIAQGRKNREAKLIQYKAWLLTKTKDVIKKGEGFFMQKISEIMESPIHIIAVLADTAVVIYVSLYFCWIFFDSMDTHFLTDVFVRSNPMTWGSYLTGIVMLIHLAVFKNIIGRCLIAISYYFTVAVSLVAIMGMTSWTDLAMFLPHVAVIVVAIVILVKQKKQEVKD